MRRKLGDKDGNKNRIKKECMRGAGKGRRDGEKRKTLKNGEGRRRKEEVIQKKQKKREMEE